MKSPVQSRRPSSAARVTALYLLLGLCAAVAGAQPPAADLRGDTWAEVQRRGRGTVTVVYYYPLDGFAYRDADGRLTGVLIDLFEHFRSYLKNVRGVDVQLQLVAYDDFPRFYADVKGGQGGVFGLAGTTITEARRAEVAFSPPFFSNMPVLVTNDEVPDLTRRDHMASELAGFTGLAFRGTTLEALLHRVAAERFPGLRIESVPSFHTIVDRLSRDRRAFAYLDLNVFWVERKKGAAIKRHRVADGPHEEFGILMPLDSDWQRPLADFFAAAGGYRNSRAYRSLLIEHLGVDLGELLASGK
jgi:putative glutamine transport system substrate-binding protein